MMILDRFIGLIAPHNCLGCDDEGSLLCEYCRSELLVPVPERCYRCHAQAADSQTCSKCRKRSRLQNVWVTTDYDGTAKALIGRLKFGRTTAAADVIAKQIQNTLPYLPEDVLIVSVPTASNRVRQRGYDQAQLIARQLVARTGHQYAPALVRMGQSRQVGSNRQQRLVQLKDAFRMSHRGSQLVGGKQILLIDDILTTGATLEAAAQILRNAGAKSVMGAVFAGKQQ